MGLGQFVFYSLLGWSAQPNALPTDAITLDKLTVQRMSCQQVYQTLQEHNELNKQLGQLVLQLYEQMETTNRVAAEQLSNLSNQTAEGSKASVMATTTASQFFSDSANRVGQARVGSAKAILRLAEETDLLLTRIQGCILR